MIKSQWTGEQYGPVLNSNDTIKMIFDVGKGYLSFIINDEPITQKSKHNTSDIIGLATNNVKKSEELKYRMAICMFDTDSVE